MRPLELSGYSLACNAVIGYGTVNSGLGTPTLTVGSSESAYNNKGFSGTMSGSLALIKDGSSLFYLDGGTKNSYSGNTTISAGTLQMRAANSLPKGTGKGNLSISGSATLDLDGFATGVNGLSGAGSVINSSVVAGAIFTVGYNNASSTYTGVIDDSANSTHPIALTKTGNGTLTITSTQNYRGLTTIGTGTLMVNGSLNSASAVELTGGTLSGGGTVGGSVTLDVDTASTLYPQGGSVLTIGGNVTVEVDSTVQFDLSSSASSGNDQVVMENTLLTVNGSPQITINLMEDTVATSDYVLFNVGVSGTISGTFNSTPFWAGTVPTHFAGYSIVTVGKTVVLRYTAIPITVTAASNSKTYDATTSAAAAPTVTSGSLASGDTGTFTETYDNKDYGSSKTMTPTGTIHDAGSADVTSLYNITWTPANVGTITAKTLTVTGLSVTGKTYNATTAATLTGTAALQTAEAPGGSTADGKPYTGDTVTLTGTAVGAFATKDVANNKSVTVSGNGLTGAQQANYAFGANEQPGLTANITVKTLTVTGLSATTKFYDGTTAAAVTGTPALLTAEAPGSATDDGKPYTGDTVSVGGTLAGTFAQREPGEYSVSVSGVAFTGAQMDNYTASPTLTGTISDTKTDSGTTTITAANTDHNFALYLNNGKLLANTASTDSINGTGTIEVNSATLGGTGKVGPVTVKTGGTVAPGASVGTLNTDSETWNGGGSYAWEISNVAGTAGVQWDLLNITGTLTVAATSGSKFTIYVSGTPTGWDNTQNYTWLIAQTSGGVVTFATNKFAIDTSGFTSKGTGGFTIYQDGNNVYLQFTHLIAGNVDVSRAWGTYMRIPVATVLAQTSGGTPPRTVTAVSSTETDYVVLSVDGSEILFAPAANVNTTRIVNYTVTDSSPTPLTASSTITVTVTNAVGAQHPVISVSGSTVTATFFGVKGFRYQVQKTISISEGSVDWQPFGLPKIADSSTGKLDITDTLSDGASAYYRLVQAPE